MECTGKKPLAALALAAATVGTLAIPAGASTPTTWTHQTLRCQGGRHAIITCKWQGGSPVDSWVDNRCGHQWVTITSCGPPSDLEPSCENLDVWPRSKVHTGGLSAYYHDAALTLGAGCDGQPPVDSCEG